MDINELKALWHEQDSRLENNLRLNNQILFQMKMDKTNNEFRRLMNMEKRSSLIPSFIAIVVICYFTAIHSSSLIYLIGGILSVIIFTIWLIFSIIRIVGFNKLSCYDESVIKVQKEIAHLKRQMFRFRKIEFMTAPIFVAAFFPLGVKVVHHYDVNLFSAHYILMVIAASVIGVGIGMWGYRIIYDKRIASAETLLKSIADFEYTSD